MLLCKEIRERLVAPCGRGEMDKEEGEAGSRWREGEEDKEKETSNLMKFL